jgi:hypothetical protein
VPRRSAIIVTALLAVGLAVFIVAFWSKGKAGSTADFCKSARSGENPLDVFARYDPANPETSHQQLQQGVDRLEQLEAAAPNELHGDTKILVDVARQLTDALDPANRDKPVPDLTSEFDDVGTASAHVIDFARTNCGLDLAPPSATAPTPSPSS